MTETETYTEWEIIYRTDGAWGSGKGSNLTPPEVDNNFYSLDWSVTQLEEAADGGGITAVIVSDGQISIPVDDGLTGHTFGPFPLPSNAIRWREDYAPLFPYVASDLFISDNTLYMVTEDHTSATEFDPTEAGSEGPLYHKVRGGPEFYDIAGYVPGAALAEIFAPTALLRVVARRGYTIPVGTTEAPAGYVFIRVPPALDLVCALSRNGSPFGYIEVSAGENVGSVNIDTPPTFAAGDVLEVSPPIGHTEQETETGTEGHGKDLSFVIKGLYT